MSSFLNLPNEKFKNKLEILGKWNDKTRPFFTDGAYEESEVAADLLNFSSFRKKALLNFADMYLAIGFVGVTFRVQNSTFYKTHADLTLKQYFCPLCPMPWCDLINHLLTDKYVSFCIFYEECFCCIWIYIFELFRL
jgi:hypothetical protein